MIYKILYIFSSFDKGKSLVVFIKPDALGQFIDIHKEVLAQYSPDKILYYSNEVDAKNLYMEYLKDDKIGSKFGYDTFVAYYYEGVLSVNPQLEI